MPQVTFDMEDDNNDSGDSMDESDESSSENEHHVELAEVHLDGKQEALQRVDLIGDFGGRELFVIDGDSLLSYFLLSSGTKGNFLSPLIPNQDQDQEITQETCSLYMIYLIEKLIDDIKQRGGCFQIVFFDTHGVVLSRGNYRLAAYREILRRHLQLNTEHKVLTFETWSNESWKQFVSVYRPLFVMTYGPLGPSQLQEFAQYSDFQRAFVNDCLRNKMSVAYMPDLLLQGGRAVAYVEYYHDAKIEDIELATIQNLPLEEHTVVHVSNKFQGCNARTLLCLTYLSNGKFDSPIAILAAKTLLLQSLTLHKINLNLRCVGLMSVNEELRQAGHKVLLDYYRIVYQILRRDDAKAWLETSEANIYDLVDEKLMVLMMQMFVNEELVWADIDDKDRFQFEEKWQYVSKAPFEIDVSQLKSLQVVPEDSPVDAVIPTNEFLTIENKLFADFYPTSKPVEQVDDVVKQVDGSADDEDEENDILPPDNRHLHLYKEVEIKKEEMDWRKLKQIQKYIAFVHRYADSLTGVKGLYNKVIVPKTRTGEDPKKKKTQSGASTKMQADNQKRLDEQRFIKAADVLKSLRAHLKTVSATKEKLLQFKTREPKMKELGNNELWFAMHWLKLQILVDDWIDFCQNSKDEGVEFRNQKAASLLEQLGVIVNQSKDVLSVMPELLPELNSVCVLLGFPELFQELMFVMEQTADQKKDAKKKLDKDKKAAGKKKGKEEAPVVVAKSTRNKELFPTLKIRIRENKTVYEVGMSLPQFQLKYLGGYMNRCNASGTVDDPRVPFRPDDWQVELLDIIDRNESALICAPTSSGKTYVAYYAMEKVISENDEDIVVYVAPTKALVNQVATEVYARFKKTYSKGQNVWGTWTKEYGYCQLDCQILVTVPETLEILLLSPAHLEWSRKIKRVIFDEIHCMGQLDGGRVWEHLLLMCTMPILCLSATVGSPELFQSYLSSIQARHAIKVHLVKCETRHSDLAKYKYEFPDVREPVTERRSRAKGTFVAVHPWGSLTLNMVQQGGIPASAKLSSDECLQVADALKVLGPAANSLFPEVYFPDKQFIKRSQVFEYERALKKFVTDLAQNDTVNFQKLVDTLSRREVAEAFKSSKEPAIFNKDVLPDIVNLAFDLREGGMLPAICFSFTRYQIEIMAKKLTSAVMSIERLLRQMDPDWEKKKAAAIKEMEARLRLKKKASASARKTSKKGGDRDDEPESRDTRDADDDRPVFDYDKPHPYCTFVGRHSVSEEDVESYINDFAYKLEDDYKFLIDAMRRGIAVHHAGMPTKYRRSVEALMRSGYLTLVFGASTLALGINMPCRTAVFFGDSIDLTASEYQQMSGRAGRRGFDQEGYVIFANVQQEKINRLMCSELPALTGHFPLTATLVVRILLLLTQAVPIEDPETISARKRREAIAELDRHKKDLQQAQIISKNLVFNDLFCMGKLIPGDQTIHYLEASVAYLRKHSLVDEQGFLIDLSGMAVNLFAVEPANLTCILLLKNGVFYQACHNVDEDQDGVCFKLAFLLCHLFNRVTIPLHKIPELKQVAVKSQSAIFLDPMPPKIASLIHGHNKDILAIYQEYCKRVASDLATTKCVLPTSKIAFNDGSGTFQKLSNRCKPTSTARSPLSALSGTGLEFESLDDMRTNVKDGILLEASAIPILSLTEGQSGRLNAYILDFLKHGKISIIERDNCIKEGESWEMLRDFGLALQAICESLKQRMTALEVSFEKCNDQEVAIEAVRLTKTLKGFVALHELFNKQFKKFT